MVLPKDKLTQGSGASEPTTPKITKPFVLEGDVSFAPRFFPERLKVSKERNLDRSENFCRGEDVTDKGTKNREVHVSGRLVGPEKRAFNRMLDQDTPFTLSSTTWSGEVRVDMGDIEGPTGYHPPSGFLFWDYTLDLVSTGLDEDGGGAGNGIIDEGTTQTTLEGDTIKRFEQREDE